MFEDKMGFNQHLLSEDLDVRQGVLNWLERVFAFYGEEGGVDVEVLENFLLLNGKSAEYIYSEFTPLVSKYIPGTRPLLENVLSEIMEPDMSDREKALTIMRRCRDNRDNARSAIAFYGGNEEELIKRGAIMCNEISRVFVCLCQIAGLPARLMGAHISGHMMSEVYIDGKWMWVDSMKGMYNFLDDGTPASTWDLMNDPSLFDRQDKKVWEDCRPIAVTDLKEFLEFDKACCQARAKGCYFHKEEAVAIGNYFVWDFDKYTYPWVTEAADPVRLEKARFAEYRMRRRLGWPDLYFDYHLFEGKLRAKE